MQLDQENVD